MTNVVSQRFVTSFAYCVAITWCLTASWGYAATTAGTVIRNQASATYKDSNGVEQTVTSNIVETIVEQVAGLQLVQSNVKEAVADTTITFSHRIQNTGTGDDRFSLTLSNSSGSFSVSGLTLFSDANADGIADNNTPIIETPWLAPGEFYYVVVSADVPNSASVGQSSVLDLTAVSGFNNLVVESNTDEIRIRDGAVITLTKSLSAAAGMSPSGSYTVTLNYENTGSLPASDVVLIDALPEGMSYVAGSAQWSGFSGSLTDSDSSDVHTGVSSELRFCAYHTSCVGLPEATNDADSTSENQVTATLSTVSVGETGQLQFDVTIEPALSAGALLNQAEYEYFNSSAPSIRQYSNYVSFLVLPDAGVVANGSIATSINGMNEPVSVNSAAQGGVVSFNNIIWNTGHNTDIYNIEVDMFGSSFPSGTLVTLLAQDGSTPLVDTNSDGLVDTGPVQSGSFATVVVRLKLPAGVSGNNGGVGFDLTKLARSSIDGSVFDMVIDHLDEIVANQVDVTNQAPAGSVGALGQGPGPEVVPVSSAILTPSGQASIDIFVRHQGNTTDSYRLIASDTATGSTLPAGWQVIFIDALTGAVITQTQALESGAHQHIIVKVQTPQGLPPGSYSLYLEAVSELTGASDRKHDALQMSEITALYLEPASTSTVQPGASVVYEHVLTNRGNASIDNIVIAAINDQPGWTSIVYEDTNLDGYLSPGDMPVSGPYSLLPGESKDLFVSVRAPVDAVVLTKNNTTVTATATTGEIASLVDVTVANSTHVRIAKEQAVDAGCDGSPDPGSTFSQSEIEVAPGNNCVVYRLTATNIGAEASFNVTIHDYTPPYTVYHSSAICSRSPCWITEPNAETTGIVKAETDQLLPGDSFHLQFLVRIQ
ncbi:MAG: DUF11 domain-containing protein [Gammaproteobacteria bacterium]|nr:DUF11 domain-containing protein [Gammaproteobacteria bacterium]